MSAFSVTSPLSLRYGELDVTVDGVGDQRSSLVFAVDDCVITC